MKWLLASGVTAFLWGAAPGSAESLEPISHPLIAAGMSEQNASRPKPQKRKTQPSSKSASKPASKATSKNDAKTQASKPPQETKNPSKTTTSSPYRCTSHPDAKRVQTDGDVELAVDRRALLRRAMETLLKQKNGQAVGDLDLVRKVFETVHLATKPEKQLTVGALYCLVRARDSQWRSGDLVFFEPSLSPALGIVKACQGSACELVVALSGQVQTVWADPTKPHVRREKDRIVNSFLRVPQPGDPRGSAYLAGELILAVGTLLD